MKQEQGRIGLTRRLFADRRGVNAVEFAYLSPVILALGLYGLETANLAYTHLKISQATANLADNVSRIGTIDDDGVKTLREADINDSLAALRRTTTGIGLTTYGRVILSSLERNAQDGQWIHWQRCIGLKNAPSTFGAAGDGATGRAFAGMGPPGQQVEAPPGSGVMFVETIYDYQPLVGQYLLGPRAVRSRAAFVVRDQRVFTDPDNPSNPNPAAPVASCTTFTA
jgi:Flp pilus assembly protein TadG